ncbi:MAG: hypothetical protein HEQ35_29185 [Gloeotrichia echinulata IR180]
MILSSGLGHSGADAPTIIYIMMVFGGGMERDITEGLRLSLRWLRDGWNCDTYGKLRISHL